MFAQGVKSEADAETFLNLVREVVAKHGDAVLVPGSKKRKQRDSTVTMSTCKSARKADVLIVRGTEEVETKNFLGSKDNDTLLQTVVSLDSTPLMFLHDAGVEDLLDALIFGNAEEFFACT